MEQGQNKQDGATFDSYDIGREGKAEYFVNIKEKPSAKNTLKKLNPFKGKRKLITIPIIVLAIIALVLLICYLAIWSKPAPYTPSPDKEPSTQYERDLSKIYQEARSKVSGNDNTEAFAYLDDLISKETDFNRRINLIILKVDIYTSEEDWQGAISTLMDMDPSTLDTNHQFDYYLRLSTLYNKLGDTEAAEAVWEKADALSTDINLGSNGDEGETNEE